MRVAPAVDPPKRANLATVTVDRENHWLSSMPLNNTTPPERFHQYWPNGSLQRQCLLKRNQLFSGIAQKVLNSADRGRGLKAAVIEHGLPV